MHIIHPGIAQQFANESVMERHLMQGLLSKPDILPFVATLFQNEDTAFSSLLANKGLTSKGLYTGMQSKEWRVVGNRKVMFPIKGIDRRKGIMLKDAEYANSQGKPGYGGEIIAIYSDTNWFSPYDVLELNDNRTLVTVVDDILPLEVEPGMWKYYVRMNRDEREQYVNPALLKAGCEFGLSYNNQYEMSETGYEKYTFDSWGWTHMTIQRLKFSYSGTAAAMHTEKYWLQHGSVISWVDYAEMKMLKQWATNRENQLLIGRGTVGDGDEVYLRDMKGREIVAGSGLLHQGDGSLKYPYSGKLNKKFLEQILQSMQLFSAPGSGKLEVAAIGGQAAIWDFMRLMKDELGITSAPQIVEGSGSTKGINNNFTFYEMGNVRFYPVQHKYFDDPSRPSNKLGDGTFAESHRLIFTSLGNADLGSPNIQLLQLGDRGFKKGTIGGIDKGGDGMVSSVDGTHTHVLCETGIAVLNMFGVAECYVPFKKYF